LSQTRLNCPLDYTGMSLSEQSRARGLRDGRNRGVFDAAFGGYDVEAPALYVERGGRKDGVLHQVPEGLFRHLVILVVPSSFQSTLALSIRFAELETKFHQVCRSPTVSPPMMRT